MDPDTSFELSAIEESFTEETKSTMSSAICDTCDFTSKYKSSLVRHINIKHKRRRKTQKVKPVLSILCDQCGKSFRSKSGMYLHVKCVHTLNFKYTCAVCGRGFNRSSNYWGHLASHHPIMKEKCTLCTAKYQYKKDLAHHIVTKHSKNPKTLKCRFCEEEFAAKDTMRYHNKALHGGHRYRCRYCSKSYKWRSSLLYHKQKCKVPVTALC